MPTLIHLNGPSRVGKSTLARRYADDHPGTLALDLDVLAGLIGGWRDTFQSALEMTRDHGLAMATRHLRAGHDVVLPQLVTSFDRGPHVEESATTAGAAYVEVALLIEESEHPRRLNDKRPSNAVEAHIQSLLDDPDCDLVVRVRRHLDAYLASRPSTVRLDTTGLDEDATYERLLNVLDQTCP